jgi:hypothetical protein
MPDRSPQFEMQDIVGTTDSYVGTATTTPANIPSSAGADIEELSIRCTLDQNPNVRLEFSLDAGTTWLRLAVGESFSEEPRGGIKQIKIRAAGNGVTSADYEIIMNRGET